MPPLKDLKGKRYGDLEVICRLPKNNKYNHAQWKCKCDCGNIKILTSTELNSGDYRSCGCKKYDGIKKHIKNDKKDGTRVAALQANTGKHNKSGTKGVCKSRGKWRAYIGFKGKQIGLGYFDNKEDAIKARLRAEEKYFEPVIEDS